MILNARIRGSVQKYGIISISWIIGDGNCGSVQYRLNYKNQFNISISENLTVVVSSFYLQNYGILHFLPEERSRMRVYLFIFIHLFISIHFTHFIVYLFICVCILFINVFFCISMYSIYSSIFVSNSHVKLIMWYQTLRGNEL